MRRFTRLMSSAGVLLAAASLSTAAFGLDESNFKYETTEDLYKICSVDGDSDGAVEAKLACRAFIEATVQYHDEVTNRKTMKRLICYPSTATIADGRSAFVAWATKNAGNAERMKELPVLGLVRSLADKYPCK